MARLGPSKNTRPERIVARWLWPHLKNLRKNVTKLYGTPDIVLEDHGLKIAVFVDGKHWHHVPTARSHQRPHHRTDWIEKAKRNRRRDRRVNKTLKAKGWTVIRIWDDCTTTKRWSQWGHCQLLSILNHLIVFGERSVWHRRTVRIARGRVSAS